MYKLISEIAERCYNAATNRGKDTTCVGCMDYLRIVVNLKMRYNETRND